MPKRASYLRVSLGIGVALAALTVAAGAATTVDTLDPSQLDCLVEPYAVVEVSSPVAGILGTIAVDRGDLVQKDQKLAELVAGVEKANVELARARAEMNDEIIERQTRLAFAQRRQVRVNDLFNKKVVSAEEKDQADTDLTLAETQLAIAKANKRLAALELQRAVEALKMRTVRSPIKGVVVERFLSPGESAEDRPIVKLAQIDPLFVEVVAPIAYLGSIEQHMSAKIILENAAGKVYEARVTVVDRVVDAASGTFGVRLELRNPEYKISAGVKCEVHFIR